MINPHRWSLPALLLLSGCASAPGVPAVVGRWDVTMQPDTGAAYPSWFEVVAAGDSLTGRWQGAYGHATPINRIVAAGDSFAFVRPPEQDLASPGATFAGRVIDDRVSGAMTALDGAVTIFAAVPTPTLVRTAPPVWDEPIDLLAGGLGDWHLQDSATTLGWRVVDGELENTLSGGNLVTKSMWMDFRLELEVNVPPGGNSGIYLRGRHEVQVLDSHGQEPSSRGMGGIYGQVTPTSNPARPPGEWQTLDITFLGRRVTVILNGVDIIDNQEIPGLTGGAMDANSGAPGPIMLQGDHGAIRFRNLRLTPAR